MNNERVLTVIQEAEILGRKIEMYGTVENPLFLASDVAKWLGDRDGYTVARKVDKRDKATHLMCTPGGNQKVTFLNEDGLYDACMLSKKKDSKQLKREIKDYLRNIRLTGAAIVDEQKTVDYYFSSLSEETKVIIFNELSEKNKELQDFYDTLMNTSGLMDMNTVAKELKIGEYTLFEYLRDKNVLFYNSDNVNIPFERFRKEEKFAVKETPCRDGKYRSVTYATKKGLEYIRKLLRKDGYYAEVSAS